MGFRSYWNFDVAWHIAAIYMPHSWRTEPTSAKVRKYQPMHIYLTSRLETPLHALLRGFVSSMEYSLRMIVLCWSIYCNGSSQCTGPDPTPLRRRGLREGGLLEAPFEAPSKGGGPGGGGGNEKREG